MPECACCGAVHATVNPATWVTEQIMLCPGCWRDLVGTEPEVVRDV